jgi:hypothetical protein
MTTIPGYSISLLSDGTVITCEGEYLGTWAIDETDAICVFTPDEASAPAIMATYIPGLCAKIEEYLAGR